MIAFMQSVFGEYTIAGTDSVNFEYVGAVAIFCICLWGVFRVVTAVFRRK